MTASIAIDYQAIVSNAKWFEAQVPDGCHLMAMVKADAYGLGAEVLVEALGNGPISRLAVSSIVEGVSLRQSGTTLPIMVLNPGHDDLKDLIGHQLEPVIHDMDSLNRLIDVLQGQAMTIHLEWNTGMNRLGFALDQVDPLLDSLSMKPHLHVASSFTHLPDTSNPDSDDWTKNCLQAFEGVNRRLREVLPSPFMVHVANTAWAIRHPELCQDMVRIGIGLFGYSNLDQAMSLTPAVHWNCKISQVRKLNKGDTVSYGRHFMASKPMVMAVLPVGYADGYPRGMSDKAHVWLQGKACPVIGDICMDAMMVDVSALPDVHSGDKVELIGDHVSLMDMAQWADTIPYEILTGLSKRLPRTSWTANS